MSDINIDYINEQLDELDETKSQIKQAIIDKGQDVSASDTFRSYASKIDNISTGPSTPFALKPYARFEILGSQTALVNYYVQGFMSGDINSLNGCTFRINYLDEVSHIPAQVLCIIVNTTPSLIELQKYNPNSFDKLFFDSNYTQIYIAAAQQLGVYNMYVQTFLTRYNITVNELLSLSGWYESVFNNGAWTLVSIANPVFTHCRCNYCFEASIIDVLSGAEETVDEIKHYFDLDALLLNYSLQDETDAYNTYMTIYNVSGDFLGLVPVGKNLAVADDIINNSVAYTSAGRLTGTMEMKDISISEASASTTELSILDHIITLDNSADVNVSIYNRTPNRVSYEQNSFVGTGCTNAEMARALQLTADKLKQGETILGIVGTYAGSGGAMTQEEYDDCVALVANILGE